MTGGHGAPDELGQDVVLAVEVEVEAAAGDAGRGQDVADGQVAERLRGEQPGGGGQDGLAQVGGAVAVSGTARGTPAGGTPARGPAPVRPGRRRHGRELTHRRVYTHCPDTMYSLGHEL